MMLYKKWDNEMYMNKMAVTKLLGAGDTKREHWQYRK